MRPEPILMFDAAYPPPVVGGKEKQAHLLARTLTEAGRDVRVLTFAMGSGQPVVYEGVAVERMGNGPSRALALVWKLIRHRVEYRLLHIHTPSNIGVLAAGVARVLGYRVLFKIPNVGVLTAGSKFRRWATQQMLGRVHRVLILEPESHAEFLQAGIPEQCIVCVDNGVEIKSMLDGTHFREDSTLRVVVTARLVPQKRVTDVVEALNLAIARGCDLHLSICGDGPERAAIEALVVRYGLTGRVEMKGHVSELERELTRAQVMVLASDFEGMPNAVLEAMSMGLPVIASGVGAVRTMMGDAGQAWIFRPRDTQRLADLLTQAASDRVALATHGGQLYSRCCSRYGIAAVADRYAEMYEALL